MVSMSFTLERVTEGKTVLVIHMDCSFRIMLWVLYSFQVVTATDVSDAPMQR